MTQDWPRYEGTKQLKATPMTRGEYNQFRGWQLPSDEDPAEAGYVVEYQDGGKPNIEGFDGYVSWSPADVFERAYTLYDADNPKGRQTSDEVASHASELLQLTGDDLWTQLHPNGFKARDVEQVDACDALAAKVRKVAASTLGQVVQ